VRFRTAAYDKFSTGIDPCQVASVATPADFSVRRARNVSFILRAAKHIRGMQVADVDEGSS